MTAIEFENISKQYRLGLVSTGTLSHDLNRFWQTKVLRREDPYLKVGEVNDRAHKGDSEYVWALKDINFKVEQGDVVGIIGRNGAGKSTLLKLLSRVTAPTTGTIRARGRIASLLEVGTGFHPEMTGRENIYMNGAIMGMSRAEITRKLDEIVDFSGCERYLDTPVKRYSSGMTVRLGFAIAAHLEPEILVVDEVLAVGDAEFQKKAIGKMQDVSRGEGRTVLFVSHNMGAVKNLCRNGILLNNGIIQYEGDIDSVIGKYTSNFDISNTIRHWDKDLNKKACITGIEISSCNKEHKNFIDSSDNISVKISYFAMEDLRGSNLCFSLYKDGVTLLRSFDIDNDVNCFNFRAKGPHITEFILPNIFTPGIYNTSLSIGIPQTAIFDVKRDAIQFEIKNYSTNENTTSLNRGGLINTNIIWKDSTI